MAGFWCIDGNRVPYSLCIRTLIWTPNSPAVGDHRTPLFHGEDLYLYSLIRPFVLNWVCYFHFYSVTSLAWRQVLRSVAVTRHRRKMSLQIGLPGIGLQNRSAFKFLKTKCWWTSSGLQNTRLNPISNFNLGILSFHSLFFTRKS